MQNVGEDIVLLAIKQNGKIAEYEKLRFAVAGSELVRLVERRRIGIDDEGFIDVLDTQSTGDELTDLALAAIKDAKPPLRAKTWVARQLPMLVGTYLAHLSAAGAIRAEDRRVLGRPRARRWIVLDAARVLEARGRLDAIAGATGPVTAEQAAFAGLAHAVGLGARLYPGRKHRAARNRLAAIARQDETIAMVGDAANGQDTALDTATAAATNSALQYATWSAVQCSVHAAHHAAVHDHQTGHTGGFDHGGGGAMAGGGHHG